MDLTGPKTPVNHDVRHDNVKVEDVQTGHLGIQKDVRVTDGILMLNVDFFFCV